MGEGKKRAATRDIVVFGQPGTGKSSIINALADSTFGQVSDQSTRRMPSTRSLLHPDGKTYRFLDTPDLDESDPVKSRVAVRGLQNLIGHHSTSLLIYCIQDKLVDMTRVNYELVWRDVFKEKVPIVLVVKGPKGKAGMDEWWRENAKTIEKMGMSFDGHTSMTSWRENWDDGDKGSAEKLWNVVRAHFAPRLNVVLFGEAGAGKSSLVNMIVGRDVAKVSTSLKGCTFKNDAYNTLIDDKRFAIYDTAGLNEGEQGSVPHWEAIRELYTLIRQLDGVSLLIYCMRGRVRENAKANWVLFNRVICGEKVPIIAVMTGLEHYHHPDDWWKEEDRRKVLHENGIKPKDIGCVVSFLGKQNQYADIYAKSQVKLRGLVMEHYLRKPWKEEKEKWFGSIYSEAFESGICFFTRHRLEYSEHMRGTLVNFIKETGMKKEDAEKLESTLMKAEKKFLKGRLKGIFF